MIRELKKLQKKMESIGIASINHNILHIRGEICYYWIPFGLIDKNFFIDIKHNCYSNCYYDYITEVPLYFDVNPIPFNLMKDKIHLHKEVVKLLKNYYIDVYEITIKDKENKNKNELTRINSYEVELELPSTIHTGEINWVICSAYQPDKIYFFSSDGIQKEETL